MASQVDDFLEDESSLCDHLLNIRLGLDDDDEDLVEFT